MPNQAFEPDEQLTAIAIGYKNDKANYIGDKILRYVRSKHSNFSYNEFPVEEDFSVPDTVSKCISPRKHVDFSAIQKTAMVETYALDCPVPVL